MVRVICNNFYCYRKGNKKKKTRRNMKEEKQIISYIRLLFYVVHPLAEATAFYFSIYL